MVPGAGSCAHLNDAKSLHPTHTDNIEIFGLNHSETTSLTKAEVPAARAKNPPSPGLCSTQVIRVPTGSEPIG